MFFGIFTLIVAVVISAVAAYYSIVGLTAIFAAAVIPIIIMGAVLEVGKITAAVWLKINWHRASITYKLYLVPAVALLMLLTSMGIFGFLSKAHSDQVLIKGDTGEQVALYDEQIKVERETIDNAKSLISQMDNTVQGILEKGESREIQLRDGRTIVRSPAELALQVRRSQAKDRAALTSTIEESQANILALQQKRAPFAAEQRNVEAKVGPIKYIAALIYGDDPDQNLLESAVRWVIIIIVAVFDPLALVLILAAQQSIRWHREENPPPTTPTEPTPDPPKPEPEEEKTEAPEFAPVMQPVVVTVKPEEQKAEVKHEYLNQPFSTFSNLKPMVASTFIRENEEEIKENVTLTMPGTIGSATIVFPEEKEEEKNNELVQENSPQEDIGKETPDEPIDAHIERTDDGDTGESRENKPVSIDTTDLTPEEVLEDLRVLEDWASKQELETKAIELPLKKIGESDYWEFRGKKMSGEVLRSDFPQIVKILEADNEEPTESHSDFGTRFPENANKGDLYLRIDYMPNKLYKYNGVKWIEVDKSKTDSYAFDERYIDYLIEKLKTGEMDVDDLSASEQALVEEKLKAQDESK
jgi:hypothetical protein